MTNEEWKEFFNAKTSVNFYELGELDESAKELRIDAHTLIDIAYKAMVESKIGNLHRFLLTIEAVPETGFVYKTTKRTLK